MFPVQEHMFPVREHMFAGRKHKFSAREHKIVALKDSFTAAAEQKACHTKTDESTSQTYTHDYSVGSVIHFSSHVVKYL